MVSHYDCMWLRDEEGRIQRGTPMIQLHQLGTHRARRRTWAVVLAGGDGQRLTSTIEAWLGEPRPKQYCTFVGKRSMLQHTLDRARKMVPAERMVTVIAPEHERYLSDAVRQPKPGHWIRQPRNRGTAAGVYLALAHILARDPQAIVILMPSDHYIHPEGAFVRTMWDAIATAHSAPERILLAGAPADRAESDYGWIVPGSPVASRCGTWSLRAVRQFIEKPPPSEARDLYRNGALWNTMITITAARTLWSLGRAWYPALIDPFDTLRRMLRIVHARPGVARRARSFLQQAYTTLPQHCFSRHILARAHQRTVVLPLTAMEWCDWGRPDRIEETLRSLGKQPAFADSADEMEEANLALGHVI